MKTIFSTLVFILISGSIFIDTSWEVEHQIAIPAPPETVWQVLSDVEQYPLWNKYSPSVTGQLQVGQVVWVEANLSGETRRVKNYVLTVNPNQELCWQSAGWYAKFARGTRCRILSNINGNTHLRHHERMSGYLAWVIEYLYKERIAKGLTLVDESLASRAVFLSERNKLR